MKRLGTGLFVFFGTSVALAQQQPTIATNSTLDSGQIYQLILAAIVGSLGTLGLLLGADRLFLAFVLRHHNAPSQRLSGHYIERILPIVIEGITVILVVLAVTLLGVLKVATSEGAIGVLGAIVGYVLGKGSSASKSIRARGSGKLPREAQPEYPEGSMPPSTEG